MVKNILDERQHLYGDFGRVATCSQDLKRVLAKQDNWSALPDVVRESLEMICVKMARICNGDPMVKDSWKDIEGYAALPFYERGGV